MRSRQLTIAIVAAVVLAAAVVGALLTSRAEDWQPLSLVGMLFVLAAGSEFLGFELKGLRLSGSFLALVLAMALLGPAPAVAIAVACALVDAAMTRRSVDRALVNLAIFAAFPLAGGLMMRVLGGDFAVGTTDTLWFAGVVLLTFMVANTLNFALAAAAGWYAYGLAPLVMLRAFVTALPSEFATGLLTASVAFTYGHLGVGSVALAAVVLLIFLYILRTSVQALERGEELETRTRELASLQMGLLSRSR